ESCRLHRLTPRGTDPHHHRNNPRQQYQADGNTHHQLHQVDAPLAFDLMDSQHGSYPGMVLLLGLHTRIRPCSLTSIFSCQAPEARLILPCWVALPLMRLKPAPVPVAKVSARVTPGYSALFTTCTTLVPATGTTQEV